MNKKADSGILLKVGEKVGFGSLNVNRKSIVIFS